MKLNTGVDAGEVGIATPIAQATSFRIAHNAQSFKILSSNLYKQPIKAIVRELGTNCLDAHLLNGFKGAFQVHVPTEDEPFFTIKDNGPGLDLEGITGLYTTYFESTKQQDENAIGAMGLGSKSPLGYVDSFQVRSHHNGECRSYIIRVNDETGVPEVLLQQMKDGKDFVETDTTGLEITIMVPDADWHEMRNWRHTVCDVYSWFGKGIVEITNDEDLQNDIYNNACSIEKTSYGDYKFGFNVSSGMWANMGGVLYPIETSDLATLDLTINERALYRNSIVLHFELGELEFVPNREGLRYGSKTVTDKSIRNALKAMKSKVQRDIKRTLDEINTFEDWSNNASKIIFDNDIFGGNSTAADYANLFSLDPREELQNHLRKKDFFNQHQGIRLTSLESLRRTFAHRGPNIPISKLVEIEISMPLVDVSTGRLGLDGKGRKTKIVTFKEAVDVVQRNTWNCLTPSSVLASAKKVVDITSNTFRKDIYNEMHPGKWMHPDEIEFFFHEKRGMRMYFKRFVKQSDHSKIVASQKEVDIFNKRIKQIPGLPLYTLNPIGAIPFVIQEMEEAKLRRAPARKRQDIVVKGFKRSARDSTVVVFEKSCLLAEYLDNLDPKKHIIVLATIDEASTESLKQEVSRLGHYDMPFNKVKKSVEFLRVSKTNQDKAIALAKEKAFKFEVHTFTDYVTNVIKPVLQACAEKLKEESDGFDVMALESLDGLGTAECRAIQYYLIESDDYKNGASEKVKQFVQPLCAYAEASYLNSDTIKQWRFLANIYKVEYTPDEDSVESMHKVKETLCDFGVYANMYMYARYAQERYNDSHTSVIPDNINDAEASLVRSLNRVLA